MLRLRELLRLRVLWELRLGVWLRLGKLLHRQRLHRDLHLRLLELLELRCLELRLRELRHLRSIALRLGPQVSQHDTLLSFEEALRHLQHGLLELHHHGCRSRVDAGSAGCREHRHGHRRGQSVGGGSGHALRCALLGRHRR